MATKVKNVKKNLLQKPLILDSTIILQECSLKVYRIPKNKNNLSKNMAFMGDSFSFYYGIE